jgi:hypothetical protein
MLAFGSRHIEPVRQPNRRLHGVYIMSLHVTDSVFGYLQAGIDESVAGVNR